MPGASCRELWRAEGRALSAAACAEAAAGGRAGIDPRRGPPLSGTVAESPWRGGCPAPPAALGLGPPGASFVSPRAEGVKSLCDRVVVVAVAFPLPAPPSSGQAPLQRPPFLLVPAAGEVRLGATGVSQRRRRSPAPEPAGLAAAAGGQRTEAVPVAGGAAGRRERGGKREKERGETGGKSRCTPEGAGLRRTGVSRLLCLWWLVPPPGFRGSLILGVFIKTWH